MFEPGQIASVRKRLGLSQSELARRSGVSQSLIAKIEAGLLDPSYSKLKALSGELEKLEGGAPRTVEQVMHREVILMYATDPVEQAIEYLEKHGISQLPVFDEGVLVGTVSESAILTFLRHHGKDAGALHRPVRDLMTEAMPQVPPQTAVDAVVSLLDLFPAVLVSANGRVQGIITKSDLLQGLKPGPSATSDGKKAIAKSTAAPSSK